MAQIETWFSQDLQQAVKVRYIDGNVFSADNNGNIIGVNVFDDGEPAALGGTVSASIIRADGATVAATGTLSGNQVSVSLPQSAYAVPGVISVVVKLTSGTDITTLLAVVGNVYQSTTDTVVDPGTIIPDISTLVAEIEAAIESIPADYSSLWTSLAPAYSTSGTYAIGQYVTYNGGLYMCISAITTAESWTAAHWTAAKLGPDISDLKSAITQVSRNLWPFDSSVTFTRYKYYKPGGVVLPAGKYVASAAITSGSGVTSARIAFDNDSGAQITYKTISTDGTRHNSPVITLTEDCYAIWLFSANGSSASTRVEATWSDIQIESGSVSTSYVPHLSARDTVAEKTIADLRDYVNKKIYGNGHLLPDSVGIESFDFVEVGTNLFNFNDTKNVSGYIANNGDIAPNASYKTSWFIKVSPSTVYYVGGQYINSYKNAKYICEFDEDLNVVLWSENVSDHFTTQSTTKYIRFTYNSDLLATKIYFGATDWDGNTAPAYTAVIPSEYVDINADLSEIEDRLTVLEDAVDIDVEQQQYSVSGNMTAGSYLKNESMANSVRHDERIMFNADITSFSGLEIGFAWYSTSYKYNRFVIDGTNLTVYNYSGDTDVVAHGLTLANNIQVIIESSFMRTCNITIISDGQLFKAEGKALDRRRVCFLYAQSVGSILPNAKLSWTCTDFNKDVWIFGDSYVASYTNKWVKYLYQYGYDKNCLFDAFPGEDSSESLTSLQNLLTIAKPKKIIWCLGMNDGNDSASEPSASWLSAQTTLRALCEEKNIMLILATIPTVPTINHEKKNANVRASGYRYIDFAKAVGADSSGHWFGYNTAHDMLSSDGIHPSDYGAKALFGRALLDAPEVMITD